MSYLALYRKYRPSSFSDVVGQNEIVSIIKNEILNDRISHAYLFSGPRGTGKTSTAKIVSKMINCENLDSDGVPCGKCASCLNFDSSSDIVEIDAASNNGVDEIRDLRDKVNLVPTYGKYKVYIIDEVHMLTTQAFNALLKTLEEPPAHIVFILATTEFYKIPITVASRCQKFQFLKFSIDDIVSRLRYIADCESISVDNDVLSEIARLSDGGMRDAINMFDQLISFGDGNLCVDDVYKLNGVLSYRDFFSLLEFISLGDDLSIINFVDDIDKSGKSFDRFIGDFLSFLKDYLIFKRTGKFFNDVSENMDLFSKNRDLLDDNFVFYLIDVINELYIKIKSSSFSKILIVTELINLSSKKTDSFSKDNIVEKSEDKEKISNTSNIVVEKSNNREDKKRFPSGISDKEKKIRINNAFATASKDLKDSFISKWSSVLEYVNNNSEFFSVTGMINDIEVMVVGSGYVIFVAQYDSLVERLYEQIDIIEKLLYDIYATKYRCVFLLKDEWNYEKERYVSAFKSGKKYEFIVPDDSFDDSSDDVVNDDVKKIVSILGNDIITYE